MYQKMYDSMAEIIRVIINYTTDDFFINYKVLTPVKRSQLNTGLQNKFPELFDLKTGQYVEILPDEKYSAEFFERIEQFVDECIKGEDYSPLVSLIEKLDLGMAKRADAELDSEIDFKEISALNKNTAITKIQLIPRAICSWERRSRGSQHFDTLGNFIKNFIYIDMEMTKGFEVKHILLPFSMFGHAQRQGKLRIGVSPVNHCTDLDLSMYEKENIRLFGLNGITNPECVEKHMKQILNKAIQEELDIVVFPEMLGTEEICDAVKTAMEDKMFENEEFYPPMVIMPSIWKENTNTSVVLNGYGEEMCRQQKQIPFIYPDPNGGTLYKEDIKADGIIYVFHCKKIGRIMIPICKDFLNIDHTRLMIDLLKATLIISPSFSSGNYDFQQMMKAVGYADCCVAWINTCSAQRLPGTKEANFDTIGAFYITGKTSALGFKEIIREEDCKYGRCKEDCLFIEEISL